MKKQEPWTLSDEQLNESVDAMNEDEIRYALIKVYQNTRNIARVQKKQNEFVMDTIERNRIDIRARLIALAVMMASTFATLAPIDGDLIVYASTCVMSLVFIFIPKGSSKEP